MGIPCVLLSFIPALQTQIVSLLRSVNGAARPCGLAVREQHKMLFAANKLEKENKVQEVLAQWKGLRGCNMRKSKRNIAITITVVAAAVLLLGSYFVYDSIFPFAEPVECPSVEDVISVTVSSSAGQKTEVYSFASLIMQIQQVKPTRKASVNDLPAAQPYYKLQVVTEEQEYEYFVYMEDNRVYLEIPYTGVYTGNYSSGNSSLVEIISDLLLNHAAE